MKKLHEVIVIGILIALGLVLGGCAGKSLTQQEWIDAQQELLAAKLEHQKALIDSATSERKAILVSYMLGQGEDFTLSRLATWDERLVNVAGRFAGIGSGSGVLNLFGEQKGSMGNTYITWGDGNQYRNYLSEDRSGIRADDETVATSSKTITTDYQKTTEVVPD